LRLFNKIILFNIYSSQSKPVVPNNIRPCSDKHNRSPLFKRTYSFRSNCGDGGYRTLVQTTIKIKSTNYLAVPTGFEPAISYVTGRRHTTNMLRYYNAPFIVEATLDRLFLIMSGQTNLLRWVCFVTNHCSEGGTRTHGVFRHEVMSLASYHLLTTSLLILLQI
jgi:hypothetical protein